MILWVIFVFSIILLWDKWQIYNGHAPLFFPNLDHAVVSNTASSNASVTNTSNDYNAHRVDTLSGFSDLAGRSLVYEIETDVLKLKFSSNGGRLIYAELLKYSDNNHDKNVVLLDQRNDYNYIVQSGLIAKEGVVPNHQSEMRLISNKTKLAETDKELVLQFESQDIGGLVYLTSWKLVRGSYVIQVEHTIKNNSSTIVHPDLYLQLLRDDQKPEGESSLYFTFTGPVAYSKEAGFHKIKFEDIQKNKDKPIAEADDGYVAMVQHYFATSWVLPKGLKRSFYTRHEGSGHRIYNVGMLYTIGELVSGGEKRVHSTLFLGPQLEKIMAEVSPGLELVKDYGWTAIISKPLYWLLFELHRVLNNWGWAIVALVVLLKAALYWLNAKAYSSMAKMKAVNPRIMALRERHKEDPKKMQQEMMRIYREEKVNPMGGCLPMLIQIPIFFALYWVLLSSVEMRGAHWIGWIHDLARPDPWFILPVIMFLTTLLQTWLNPKPADPMQARLMWFMPLIFSVMFFFFPAGLVLYWVTNNILTIAQQWIINRRLGVN